MTQQDIVETAIPRRDPAQVMRLARLGSFHQSRLSFMRILLRRIKSEGWQFSVPVFDVNANGVGHAVYCAHTPDRSYSLVAFAHDLPDELRSDRVIAEAWDCTFTLFDGVPTDADIDRLRQNVPLQEAGRVSERELSVSRANRSVRLWDYMVTCLSEGHQPDPAEIAKVGYLMRTTAVYGSGKLGAADRETICERPECAAPFQIEMLSVYLTRAFVRDLMQNMANQRGGQRAVNLDPEIARSLGIGNSTGLGMAPFLINHPVLFNNWIMVKEEALARIRSLPSATGPEAALFRSLLDRSRHSADLWHTDHPGQMQKVVGLRSDLKRLETHLDTGVLGGPHPWDRLYRWCEANLGLEAQECVVSLMLEPCGDLVDGLASCMADQRGTRAQIDGAMKVGEITAILEAPYGWALEIDWEARESCARAWYVSAEKLEPRLGERFEEPLDAYEQPLAPGRDAAELHRLLQGRKADQPIANLLLEHPEMRHVVRRAQLVKIAPYGEIRDNTVGADLMPIDMLRCKLSFFGATRFDPRSDRWVRICMFANAPYPEELHMGDAEHWPYPSRVGAP